jgi:hypothetical protein
MLKHVGKMKHNDAKVCVVYRTLPGDAYSALVVGTSSLTDAYHNTLVSLVESPDGQQANELGDALSNRYFPDGSNMLEHLHMAGKLVKVPTKGVWMTPTPTSQISLDELNGMIAEQKGVTLEDLSIKDAMPHEKQKEQELKKKAEAEKDVSLGESIMPLESILDQGRELTAKDYRVQADKLFKEAARLRKIADDMEPPEPLIKKRKPRAKKVVQAG